MEKFFNIANETDHIVKIELVNGKKHNPLSLELIKELTNSLIQISLQKKIKVLIISSEGPAFSAGHDLDELRRNKNNKKFFKELFDECSNLMQTIMNLPQPVIAEVCGIAAAAGCQLVASCDLAVASENANFMTPGVNIGLFCSTPMVAISRKISSKDMMYMLLSGERISALEAEKIKLINKVFPKKSLKKEVLSIATNVTKKSNQSIKIGKLAFYKQLDMSIEKAYEYTSKVMTKNMGFNDAKEGIEAFIEKRSPNWKS